MSGKPDPKPSARKVNRAGGRKKLAEGRCRICELFVPLTRHHLVPKSLGGSDVEDNIVPLCGDGVRGCHGLIEDRDPVACSTLRSRLKKKEIAYILKRKNPVFLDRYYPLAA